MANFGKTSKRRLKTCHPDIQKIMNEVIKIYDFSVLEGERTLEKQQEYYRDKKSKKDGIHNKSKHQSSPSLAIDIIPYPMDWSDLNRFHFLAGLVFAKAHELGIEIRWGGDWDKDFDFKDQDFNDLPHFELV